MLAWADWLLLQKLDAEDIANTEVTRVVCEPEFPKFRRTQDRHGTIASVLHAGKALVLDPRYNLTSRARPIDSSSSRADLGDKLKEISLETHISFPYLHPMSRGS